MIRCGIAVLPSGYAAPPAADQLVTCGFSPQDTLTLSSAKGPLLSLQRRIVTGNGAVLEPQELKFLHPFSVTERSLCAVAAALICDISPEEIVRRIPRF